MFEIASVTKQFTAAAILQLRDQGKLSLDDDITRWFPDLDTRGNKVPLRRLLDHTSGIGDVTGVPGVGMLLTNLGLQRDAMYGLIKLHPFQFPTGTAQVYNNSAYWLLEFIIEKASGLSYERYIESKLFEPLGMKRSMVCNSSEDVPRRAKGYVVRNGVRRRARPDSAAWSIGPGVLCSTAGDLVTWLKALHGGKVLAPGSYAEMIKPSTLSDGTVLRYAMGPEVGQDVRGVTVVGHGGETAGFASRANWYPDAKMAVVVLINNSGDGSAAAIAENLAAAVLPGTRRAPRRFTGNAAPLCSAPTRAPRDGATGSPS